ncbi:MAG TPA: Hsp20/alpha crystallin family protein [Firmicutes bacterium]|jgi:HSP20 family protein|nr:Hsp20/alpha crystallin family protein [Bacillota bacterium]
MYRMMPFRRRNRGEAFWPQTWQDFFSWPESFWEGFPGFGGFGTFNVDVKETNDGYHVLADLPGVAKENIQLSLDGGYLTIAVRADEIRSENNENYLCRERRQMSSQRSFYVGDVDPADVKARFENGVLDIKVPRGAQGPDRRQIPIN